MVILAFIAIPVLVYGLFRYRRKRNLYWWVLVVTAFFLLVIGVFFAAVNLISEFAPSLQPSAATSLNNSVPTQPAEAQAIQGAVTPTTPSLESEQELFREYDTKIGEWFDSLLLVDDEPQGQFVATAKGRHFFNKGVRDEMQNYEPPPKLRTQHAMFTSYVAKLILADRALDLDPPDDVEWQRRYLEAQDLLDEAIEDYADYGTSLGIDIWPGFCAGNPNHFRCN